MAGFDLVPGHESHNYTGILTRSIVFSGTLLAFLAGKEQTRLPELALIEDTDDASATGLTLASIIVPNWISFENHTVRQTYL